MREPLIRWKKRYQQSNSREAYLGTGNLCTSDITDQRTSLAPSLWGLCMEMWHLLLSPKIHQVMTRSGARQSCRLDKSRLSSIPLSEWK